MGSVLWIQGFSGALKQEGCAVVHRSHGAVGAAQPGDELFHWGDGGRARVAPRAEGEAPAGRQLLACPLEVPPLHGYDLAPCPCRMGAGGGLRQAAEAGLVTQKARKSQKGLFRTRMTRIIRIC